MRVYDVKFKGIRRMFTFRTYESAYGAARTKGVDGLSIPKVSLWSDTPTSTCFLYRGDKIVGSMTERTIREVSTSR